MGEYNIKNFEPVTGIWFNAGSTPVDMTTLVTEGTVIRDNNNTELTLITDGTDVFIPTMDVFLQKTHFGDSFYYIHNFTISNVGVGTVAATLAFQTDNRSVHLKPRIYFNAANVEGAPSNPPVLSSTFYVNPTISSLGNADSSVINMNMTSNNTSTTIMYPNASSPSGSYTGVIYIPGGVSTSLGTNYEDNYELILKPNTLYAIAYTNVASYTLNGYFSCRMTWYEE